MTARQVGRDTSFLDLARGIAALWVMLAHCSIWGASGLWTSMVEPKKAVYLFMAVSGFLMMYTLDRGTGDPQWRKFYARRYFRIAPAYYLALALTIIGEALIVEGMQTFQLMYPSYWDNDKVYGAPFEGVDAWNVAAHLTFLFGFFPKLSVSTLLPDWSLGLEMQFYAAFPLLYMAARRWPAVAVALLLTAVCAAFTSLYAIGVQRGIVTAFDEPTFLLFSLPYFLVGMLIYQAGVGRPMLNLTGAVLVFIVTAWGTGHSRALLGLILAAMAYLWVVDFPAFARRICHSRIIVLMSECSYAVYLLHGMVLMIVGSRVLVALKDAGIGHYPAMAVMMLVVTLCTYPLAWAVFRWVEVPGMALGKRLTGTTRPIAPAMT